MVAEYRKRIAGQDAELLDCSPLGTRSRWRYCRVCAEVSKRNNRGIGKGARIPSAVCQAPGRRQDADRQGRRNAFARQAYFEIYRGTDGPLARSSFQLRRIRKDFVRRRCFRHVRTFWQVGRRMGGRSKTLLYQHRREIRHASPRRYQEARRN